jgi:hypothetical protein
VFAAQRTRYTVRVDRPGHPSFEQTRDFSAELHEHASKANEWNVVLPD